MHYEYKLNTQAVSFGLPYRYAYGGRRGGRDGVRVIVCVDLL